MTHIRTTLRNTLKTVLIAAATDAGSNVRVHPFNAQRVFPSITIEDLGANHSDGQVTESMSPMTVIGALHLQRVYRVCVLAEVMQGADADVARDDLCEQIEAAVAAAHAAGTFGRLHGVTPIAYQSSDSNEGDSPVRRGLTIFEFRFSTSQGDPSTLL